MDGLLGDLVEEMDLVHVEGDADAIAGDGVAGQGPRGDVLVHHLGVEVVHVNLIPPWPADPPVWELRVGAYRVFYDVSEEEKVVRIRANIAGVIPEAG